MGIKNLHKILQKYAPSCYTTKHLSEYSYKKIAIDISLYLYKYKAINGDNWLESFIALVSCLRKWDVHCIFIYDGKAPVEKIEEQQRRVESRVKQTDKIKQLEFEIKEYEEFGTVGEMMKEINEKEGVVSLFRKPKEHQINLSVIKTKLESMKGMVIHITQEDVVLSQQLFDVLQIPYVKAPAEAECYASQLCVDGKVDCVLSEDTDVLAYGTPLFLTKIDYMKDTVVEINYSNILSETGMTKETFTDLCIMCSCDYNTNIYLIGPEKSYTLLKEYKCIEEVLAYLLQHKKYTEDMFTPLKYLRCREMFSTAPQDFYAPYCGIPEFSKLSEFLAVNSIRCNLAQLKKNFSPRELVFEE